MFIHPCTLVLDAGVKIVPYTLEIGDYLLTPKLCVGMNNAVCMHVRVCIYIWMYVLYLCVREGE